MSVSQHVTPVFKAAIHNEQNVCDMQHIKIINQLRSNRFNDSMHPEVTSQPKSTPMLPCADREGEDGHIDLPKSTVKTIVRRKKELRGEEMKGEKRQK